VLQLAVVGGAWRRARGVPWARRFFFFYFIFFGLGAWVTSIISHLFVASVLTSPGEPLSSRAVKNGELGSYSRAISSFSRYHHSGESWRKKKKVGRARTEAAGAGVTNGEWCGGGRFGLAVEILPPKNCVALGHLFVGLRVAAGE